MSPWLIFGLVWLAGMIGFVAGFLAGRAFGYFAGFLVGRAFGYGAGWNDRDRQF